MREFQLDEDMEARHIKRNCDAKDVVKVHRLPRQLRNTGLKDPAMLARLLPLGNAVISMDVAMPYEHSRDIPQRHPGIIVIGDDEDAIMTMSTHRAERIIGEFKREVADWHKLPTSNSILVIRPSCIEVVRAVCAEVVQDEFVFRSTLGWQDRMRSALDANEFRA